jgi:hypothetical protein
MLVTPVAWPMTIRSAIAPGPPNWTSSASSEPVPPLKVVPDSDRTSPAWPSTPVTRLVLLKVSRPVKVVVEAGPDRPLKRSSPSFSNRSAPPPKAEVP